MEPPFAPDRGGTTRTAQVRNYTEVMDALYALEHVERTALRLIYWRGRSQREVAQELGIPAAAVRTAVARGMRLLADRITES